MPALAAPVADERSALREYLDMQQRAFFAVAHGLTDEQARATPTTSALSIGGLVKHAAGVQRGWMERARHAPDFPPPDPRPREEIMAAYRDEYVMRADETLAELLAALERQNAETLRLLDELDLDTPVPVPHEVPWFPRDVEHWSVRWVFHHLIGELARHAGHADIIRESIDGATMYELIAAAEGWPETDWLKPWRPRG
ncbi:DinB family protein [uncultured Mycolicibacterium sp.]|uniref:DinB family protein n=1 Tax=uncultured Mycolicibacterium sp. TaxID=2320817 RepID=UPI0026183127|nr:DinB family protein [uncultured Mycolicibacterium sp.]